MSMYSTAVRVLDTGKHEIANLSFSCANCCSRKYLKNGNDMLLKCLFFEQLSSGTG